MKMNKIAIVVMTSFLLPSVVNATTYNSIIHKHEYEAKKASLIPGEDEGINVVATNTTTNQVDAAEIMKTFTKLSNENGHFIELSSDVKDQQNDDMTLTGTWKSSIPINFITNNKNETSFVAPDYDGKYFINLELTDGIYTRTYQALQLDSEYWTATDPLYGEWQIDKVEQDWSPDLNLHYENELVEQTKITDRSRTKQEREIRNSTGDTRDNGAETIEYQDNYTETRDQYGLMEYWEPTDPKILVDWAVTEILVDWTPDAANVYETEEINQYREVKKERTVQDQEVRPKTGDIRTVGGSYKDTSLTTEYRTVMGELEYWENVGTPTCTEWALDRYDPWLPDASNVPRDETVDQTRTKYESRECTGQQYRPATGEYRDAESEVEYRSEEESRTINGTKIDLNDWFTNDSNGNWSVSNDGSYAFQSINGNQTIFESAANTYGNTVIKGRMRVRSSAGDDDFIGMVLGKTDANNFILWSWKKNNQSINGGTALEGHALANVTGGVAAINWFMHQSKSGYTVLDTNNTSTNGWNHDTYYEFEIRYTPTSISVKVNGTEVVAANGSFAVGKIGFFNLSQGEVEYYKVSDDPITD